MRSSMLSVAALLALGLAVPAAAQQGKPVAKAHRAMTVAATSHHQQAPTDTTKAKMKHHRAKKSAAPAAKPAAASSAPAAAPSGTPAAKPAKTMKHKRAKPDSTKKPPQR